MRLFAGDTELLNTLASMPFLDRLELATVSGRSPAAVYERIDRFAEAGLVEIVSHSNDLITPIRRYRLSAHGQRRLASEREVSIAEPSRSAPVSEQWRWLILERWTRRSRSTGSQWPPRSSPIRSVSSGSGPVRWTRRWNCRTAGVSQLCARA